MCACVVQRIGFAGEETTIYLVYFPVSCAGSLPEGDHAWIPKPAFESLNQPVDQCRSILLCLYSQYLPILAGGDEPLLPQTEFSNRSALVGDWSEHDCAGLGASKSELDNGSHFTSVFASIRRLNTCRNHCDYMASES